MLPPVGVRPVMAEEPPAGSIKLYVNCVPDPYAFIATIIT